MLRQQKPHQSQTLNVWIGHNGALSVAGKLISNLWYYNPSNMEKYCKWTCALHNVDLQLLHVGVTCCTTIVAVYTAHSHKGSALPAHNSNHNMPPGHNRLMNINHSIATGLITHNQATHTVSCTIPLHTHARSPHIVQLTLYKHTHTLFWQHCPQLYRNNNT